MYGIYKRESLDEQPRLVGVCHTKLGAKNACRHFSRVYARETGHTFCHITYQQMDAYWVLRLGYLLLRITRKIEERKLRRLEYEERIAITEREAQSRKVASLY